MSGTTKTASIHRLPELIVGKTYTRSEVEDYIADQRRNGYTSNDYATMLVALDELHGWERPATGANVMVMEYRVWPIARFEKVIREVQNNFGADRDQIERIKSLLQSGASAFPIWILYPDQEHPKVGEGNHRLLAFHELGLVEVPVFLVKYEPFNG